MKTKILKNQATNYSSKFENKPLKKWFVLVTVLLLFGFNKVSAQNEFDVNVYNYSNCTWTITAYDASLNVLYTSSIPATPTFTSFLCLNQGLGAAALDHIVLTNGTSPCSSITYTFGSSGVFSYTQYTGICCGSDMNCSGGAGTAGPSPCGPSTGKNLLININ